MLLLLAVLTAPASADALDAAIDKVVDGRFEEARPQIERVLSEEPNRARAHYALGVTLKHLGEFEQAAQAYRQAHDLADGSLLRAQALYGIALTWDKAGEWSHAHAAWESALPAVTTLENAPSLVPVVTQKMDRARRNAAELEASAE